MAILKGNMMMKQWMEWGTIFSQTQIVIVYWCLMGNYILLYNDPLIVVNPIFSRCYSYLYPLPFVLFCTQKSPQGKKYTPYDAAVVKRIAGQTTLGYAPHTKFLQESYRSETYSTIIRLVISRYCTSAPAVSHEPKDNKLQLRICVAFVLPIHRVICII